ncbi:unnamed protein product [Adineta steineri]|uniref:Uncharacterized protein n=1 Tax=Adineta steineri TaxID=433720 RepID=A0A818SVX7_9BILA|nr:unnamed protein product [Adineta steineri]
MDNCYSKFLSEKGVILIRGCLPVAFCLLPKRQSPTYTELFQRLKHEATVLRNQFESECVISDFERPLLSVIRQAIPSDTHPDFLFHFTQAIHRKITNLGLRGSYAQGATIREQFKQLMVLSLMPICEVETPFKCIREISLTSLEDLFVYFRY